MARLPRPLCAVLLCLLLQPRPLCAVAPSERINEHHGVSAIDGGAAAPRGYDVVLVSSACPPEECGALERLFKRAAGPAGDLLLD